MTRSEEIKQRAEEYRQPYRDGGYHLSSKDVMDAFEEGAEWADKTIIEKACKWLFENVYDYLNPEDQERVESFRKYLEEQYESYD